MFSSIRSAIVSVYVFFRPGKPVSRKVIAAALTSLFVYLITIIAVKRGAHLDETQTDIIAALAANAAGFCAGWLRKEFPEVVTDGQDLPQSSLAAPALPPAGQTGSAGVTENASSANLAEVPAEAAPNSATPNVVLGFNVQPGPPPPAS